MKVLHLTLKRRWFDMIASGEKKEEYREIKPYWGKRLTDQIGDKSFYKEFDVVYFRNGYSKHAPVIAVECKGIGIATGNPQWGAEPNIHYFVIKLGKVLTITK